jgi:hypothetical protein
MTMIVTVLLGAIGSIVAAELLDVCPWLTQKLLRRAANRLPATHRERYVDEWQAELDYMNTRAGKLFRLLWAIGVCASSSSLAREIADVPQINRQTRAAPVRLNFPRQPVFYGGSVRLDGVNDLDIPTVIRDLDDPPQASSTPDFLGDRGYDMRVRGPSGVFVFQMKHHHRTNESDE